MQPAILVVDDEPQLLRLLIRVFEREGYPVLSSAEGLRACEIIDDTSKQVAALVLDAGVAPIGAAPILARVLARPSRIGVVLVSGDPLTPELSAWIGSHDGRFLRKPFLPETLVEAVQSSIVAVTAVQR